MAGLTFMSDIYSFFATAPRGVASVLADELRALDAEVALKEQPGGVIFESDLAFAYRVCLWSRTASRVLLKLDDFYAPDAEALYHGVQAINWFRHLNCEQSLAVDVTLSQSRIDHSHFAALKVKDAIVDQMRDDEGRRPSVDTQRPDLRLHVYIRRDQATVYLDLSGETLHRRGYRQDGAAAPLKENLAAALLLRAGWPAVAENGGCLLDPMCGSGTLAIEAAQIALNRAPGLQRDYWGFAGWRGHQPDAWQALCDEAKASSKEAGSLRIEAYDIDGKALAAARDNIAAAGLDDVITLRRQAVAELTAPADCAAGLVMVNPPYGERLGEGDALVELYQTFGARLREQFVGWQAAVFTGNPELAKQLGIRSQRKHKFFNGALECLLLRFDITPEWFMNPRRLPPAATELSESAQMLANRLRKNIKQLAKWAQREAIDCYRVYDADIPEYALAIDLYQGDDGQRWLHVQEYEAPRQIAEEDARRRLREALAVIPDVMQVETDKLFLKVRKRQKGKAQYEKVGAERQFHQVRENGCRFWVNFSDYLDTGLFLDHRITRGMLAELAQGRDFLNLFAYTGSGTVYAAHGGARSTTTVDMSRTYLDWAQRNMGLNGFKGPRHQFVQADCLRWLEQAQGERQRYGLIFLDPPTFSTSKRMQDKMDVQQDHVRMIRHASQLLTADGVLVFSNNFRKFRLDTEALSELEIEDISRKTIPQDFARNDKIHRCWLIRRPPSAVWRTAAVKTKQT